MTTAKQFGTFMTKCHPTVEELAASGKNREMLPIAFATSLLRRTLEEITGSIDGAEAGPTVKRSVLCRNLHVKLDKCHTTKSLDCQSQNGG